MKLQPHEVRIGNWVTNSNDDVFQISTGAFFLYHQNKELDVLAIPITEEWLLEKGLIEDTAIYGTPPPLPYPYSIVYSHEFGAALVEYTEYSKEVRYIKYVHQLQNLYFALTGEELEI